jgi:hypothetical protein
MQPMTRRAWWGIVALGVTLVGAWMISMPELRTEVAPRSTMSPIVNFVPVSIRETGEARDRAILDEDPASAECGDGRSEANSPPDQWHAMGVFAFLVEEAAVAKRGTSRGTHRQIGARDRARIRDDRWGPQRPVFAGPRVRLWALTVRPRPVVHGHRVAPESE